MKRAICATLLAGLTHLDAASKQRHPEPVEGISASALRPRPSTCPSTSSGGASGGASDARSGRKASSRLARPCAIALALLAGFLLVLALAACGETNGIDIEATATALASVGGTPDEGEPIESTRLGQWVEASGLAMVAYTVEDPAVVNTDLYELKPGTRLVAVELEVGCLEDSHNFTPQEARLIDSRGRRHEPVYRAMAEHSAISTGIINLGDRVRGWLAFELPEGVTAESLEYKPNIWNRVIELEVSLVE